MNISKTKEVIKLKKGSTVSWIKYDINWNKLAKSSCKKCHGRGYEGYEVLPPKEEAKLLAENKNWAPARMLCDCAVNRWVKMEDDERMNFATLKENAEAIQEEAVSQIKKVVAEEADKQGIEIEMK